MTNEQRAREILSGVNLLIGFDGVKATIPGGPLVPTKEKYISREELLALITAALDAKDRESEVKVREVVERCAKVAEDHRSGRKPMELLRARADVIMGRDAASEEIVKAIRSLFPTEETKT